MYVQLLQTLSRKEGTGRERKKGSLQHPGVTSALHVCVVVGLDREQSVSGRFGVC